MKNIKIALIAFLCTIILFLSIGLYLGISAPEHTAHSIFARDDYQLIQEKEIAAKEVSALDIQYQMNSYDVYFYESEDDRIVIKEYQNISADEKALSAIELDDGSLTIQGNRSGFASHFLFGRTASDGYTEIYLPADFAAEISVSTASGNILSEQPSASGQDLTASTVSGDIFITRQSGSFAFDTTSGNISVKGGDGMGCAHTVSGDILLFLDDLTGDLTISSTSGNVSLKLPETAAFCLEFDSTSGDCHTFFDEMLSFHQRDHQADGSYGNDPETKITVSTTSGDLRINRKSNVTFHTHARNKNSRCHGNHVKTSAFTLFFGLVGRFRSKISATS